MSDGYDWIEMIQRYFYLANPLQMLAFKFGEVYEDQIIGKGGKQ